MSEGECQADDYASRTASGPCTLPMASCWDQLCWSYLANISYREQVYILTLSDYFTKWVEAVPLENKEAPGVAIPLQKLNKTCFTVTLWLCTRICLLDISSNGIPQATNKQQRL